MLQYYNDLPYTVAVVGAGSGIGKATAELIGAMDVSVGCLDKNGDAAEEVAEHDRTDERMDIDRHHSSEPRTRRCTLNLRQTDLTILAVPREDSQRESASALEPPPERRTENA